ncbi:hypothetical protein PFTANZ_06186, partial [Plasmodium falciparum Tanzania (2000708)]
DKARHNLLADVCLAANHEGQSIKTHLEQYDAEYPSGSGHTTCTALARSFADIGDIIRGKDLYFGKKKKKQNETERDQLESKLKEIFKKIHGELKDAKKHYEGDTTNYYQLREDWWTANRETVWKALTCSDDLKDASYFRATCGGDRQGPSVARNQCRCGDGDKPKSGKGGEVTIVPTYFDYVPQYLRWFEEWAEDFCRKKNKKLQDVKTNCLDETKGKYCSLNGYDCTKTKLAIGKYRMGNQCISCLYACNPYVDWINNQKEQFDKQKQKYINVINGAPVSGRQKGGARGKCGTVGEFLEKLSAEDVCKKITDEKEGKIDFKNVNSGSASVPGGGTSGASGTNNEKEGTFYRSKYCQPCPHCGMKKKNGNEWENKSETDNCTSGKLYKPKNGQDGTKIEILKSGEGETEIKEKLEEFCKTQNGSDGSGVASGDKNGGSNSRSKELYQEWKCYQIGELTKVGEGEDDVDDLEYDEQVKNAGGLCILENKNKKEKGKEKESDPEPAEFQKTFHDFFYYWVAHMLKDSIHWRTKKLEKCLKNEKKKCGNQQCKVDCDCFKNWIGKKKKKEWDKIVQHFNTQDGFGKQGEFLGQFRYDVVLKF